MKFHSFYVSDSVCIWAFYPWNIRDRFKCIALLTSQLEYQAAPGEPGLPDFPTHQQMHLLTLPLTHLILCSGPAQDLQRLISIFRKILNIHLVFKILLTLAALCPILPLVVIWPEPSLPRTGRILLSPLTSHYLLSTALAHIISPFF